jgi:hypothetical protein
MEYAKLETAALAHVDVRISTARTAASASMSLEKLRAHLGDDFPLVKCREDAEQLDGRSIPRSFR